MTSAISLMTEEEIRRVKASDDEAGFGSLSTEKGQLPLTAMDVRARIVGLTAEVSLEQTFVNALDEPLEATYVFPLPDRAGVTRFQMVVAGRVVDGEIKERGAARREYQEAIELGHRAAITEEERPGVFTLRVGNLMPREVATVRLTMTGPLPYDEGEATFRFPLVVAPRYIPGRALPGESVGDGTSRDTDAVPDASRITPPILLPGYPNPVRLAISVDLDPGGLPLAEVRSSLHAITVEERERARRIEIRPGERADRDFILRFRLGEDAVKTSLELRPDPKSEAPEGTFLLTVVPPISLSRAEKPRDVVFVLDRSGSMGGWKMIAARRAAARMIDTLREKDTFAVFAFDDQIDSPPSLGADALSPATDRNRFRAVEFLASVDARGGTEMAEPLERAVKLLAGGYQDRERILVLVTDGQVGNEDQILKRLAGGVKNTRIFTLGVDRAVNEGFLKRLAALGGGLSELVESEDRLDEVMDKIHRRIQTPLVTELAIVPSGLEIVADSIVPGRIPDLFAGAPVTVSGRYRGPAQGKLTATGRDGLGRPWSETISASVTTSAAITTIWARGRVRELEDRFVIGSGDRADLERKILSTSLDFGVLSRFTAFLAVDRSEKVNPGGPTHRVLQPVESPEGWLSPHAPPPPAMAMSAAPVMASASFGAMDRLSVGGAVSGGPARMSARAMSPPAPGGAPAPMKADAKKKLRSRGKSSLEAMAEKVHSLFEREKEEAYDVEAPAEAPLELAPYRERARRLLEPLAKGGGTALAALVVSLRALVEDLESIGAAAPTVEPLKALLVELATAVSGAPGAAETTALVARATAALTAFADDTAKPVAASRDSFWKDV